VACGDGPTPIFLAVRMMRQAISPRLAMMIFSKGLACGGLDDRRRHEALWEREQGKMRKASWGDRTGPTFRVSSHLPGRRISTIHLLLSFDIGITSDT
jgi:hypothetical protein